MHVKQTIAIIGAAGNMGQAIAKALAKEENRLLLFSSNQQKAQLVAEEIKSKNAAIEVEGTGCPVDASWEADIIILAVPYQAEAEIAKKIEDVARQKIVISISNPLNETFDGLVTLPGTSAGEELQKILPDSKVIKAFNTTYAVNFVQPLIDGKQTDAFIAGDHATALTVVEELVRSAGFNPIVAGPLKVSQTLENMQLLLIQLTMKYNYNWHAGWKILHN